MTRRPWRCTCVAFALTQAASCGSGSVLTGDSGAPDITSGGGQAGTSGGAGGAPGGTGGAGGQTAGGGGRAGAGGTGGAGGHGSADACSDGFDRPDNTVVGMGWTEHENPGNSWSIVDQELQAARGADAILHLGRECGHHPTFDASIQIRMASVGGALYGYLGVNCTSANAAGSCLAIYLNRNDSALVLLDDGILVDQTAMTIADGVDYRLRMEWDGATLRGKAWPVGEAEPPYQLSGAATDEGGTQVVLSLHGDSTPAMGTAHWDELEVH